VDSPIPADESIRRAADPLRVAALETFDLCTSGTSAGITAPADSARQA